MKVLVTTIQNSGNYGAMLQAYALKRFLLMQGHEVDILNYDNRYMSKGLDLIRHGFSKIELYYSIIDLLNLEDRKTMLKRFNSFQKKYLGLGKPIKRDSILIDGCPGYDVYISGSDQIWNPNITNGFVDEVYYCGMSNPNGRIMSYASSFGGYDFMNNVYNNQIKTNLEKYDAISTRESNYISIIEKLTGKNVKQVLDPVFLLDKDEWRRSISCEPVIDGPYLLVYAMSKHEKILARVLNEFREKYKIVMIYEPLYKKRGVQYIINAGPREFVSLFQNADLIVTNSFHGTAFSIIFNKQFIVPDNFRNKNRIHDLLIRLGLDEVMKSDNDHMITNKDIDYYLVNQKLCNMINSSIEFLNSNLASN